MLKRGVLFILLLLCTGYCLGLDSLVKNYYKNFETSWTAEVPIWIPGLRGTLSYGRINTENPDHGDDTDFERVDNDDGLEFYFNGRLTKRFQKFWLSFDAFSGKIGSQFSFTTQSEDTEIEFIDITVSGTSSRFTAGFSVYKSNDTKELYLELIPYIGMRYTNFRLKSDVFNVTEVIDLNPNWLEPLIGLYLPVVYKRFQLELQGDYGWRNNSNSTWHFMVDCVIAFQG